jgi:hypothetical protein
VRSSLSTGTDQPSRAAKTGTSKLTLEAPGVLSQLHNQTKFGCAQRGLDRPDDASPVADTQGLTYFKRLVMRQMPRRHDLVAAT